MTVEATHAPAKTPSCHSPIPSAILLSVAQAHGDGKIHVDFAAGMRGRFDG